MIAARLWPVQTQAWASARRSAPSWAACECMATRHGRPPAIPQALRPHHGSVRADSASRPPASHPQATRVSRPSQDLPRRGGPRAGQCPGRSVLWGAWRRRVRVGYREHVSVQPPPHAHPQRPTLLSMEVEVPDFALGRPPSSVSFGALAAIGLSVAAPAPLVLSARERAASSAHDGVSSGTTHNNDAFGQLVALLRNADIAVVAGGIFAAYAAGGCFDAMFGA